MYLVKSETARRTCSGVKRDFSNGFDKPAYPVDATRHKM